jgi:dTDP-4-dehydrorhamnose reductase
MKILIFGSKGQLGTDLMHHTRQAGHTIAGVDLPECNITDEQDVHRIVQENCADVVINAAAYTSVDDAEKATDLAFAVNADGPAYLARACRDSDVPLIHLSTDYVFNGLTTRPYLPSDAADPMGAYGRSKAAGEKNIERILPSHVIVRTSWLFGLHGPNFVKTMLRVGKDQAEVEVVDDQVGSPTYAPDLAAALTSVAEHIVGGKTDWGIYHFCNRGAVTWYAFARRIFAFARQHDLFAVRDIRPILTSQYALPASRPHYSVLDCTSFEETFGIQRRSWEEALGEMIAALYPE